ncbi:hypothetical protein [Kitasatospora sp. GAS1066B]|uniref:hypothetical protein n=1 Tax=Kitasatospora sp. GAS1066B TaxID=3156271 RepID=UPI0035190055
MTPTPDPLGLAAGPGCWLTGCATTPAVQWRRRHAIGADDIEAVFACPAHALTLDGAAHIHQPQCTVDPTRLPACGCTPEPLPAPVQVTAGPTPAATTAPGWATPPPTT